MTTTILLYKKDTETPSGARVEFSSVSSSGEKIIYNDWYQDGEKPHEGTEVWRGDVTELSEPIALPK